MMLGTCSLVAAYYKSFESLGGLLQLEEEMRARVEISIRWCPTMALENLAPFRQIQHNELLRRRILAWPLKKAILAHGPRRRRV